MENISYKVLIKSFEDEKSEELCKKVNAFGYGNNIIATQTLTMGHLFVAFVYYK